MKYKTATTAFARHLNENGITQAHVMRVTGLNKSTINGYYTGRFQPGLDNARAIAGGLGISDQVLFPTQPHGEVTQ